jgi:hypothetical protein
MFTNAPTYALCVAALSLMLSTPAHAHRIEVGTGVFCDTQRQVERFVAVFNGDARAALNVVNAEEKDPTACVFGTIAYIRGPEVATARSRSGTYHIVEVLVVGFLTEAGFRAAGPAASFSIEKVDERVA